MQAAFGGPGAGGGGGGGGSPRKPGISRLPCKAKDRQMPRALPSLPSARAPLRLPLLGGAELGTPLGLQLAAWRRGWCTPDPGPATGAPCPPGSRAPASLRSEANAVCTAQRHTHRKTERGRRSHASLPSLRSLVQHTSKPLRASPSSHGKEGGRFSFFLSFF